MARSRTSFGAVFTALRLATRPGGPSLWARVSALPRLVRATAKGAYQDTPASQLALMVGALAYLITPVDLMPEALLGPFGLLDDAFVLAWLAGSVVQATEDYLGWERAGGAQRPQAGDPATVRSHVVD
ncbi:YkvA family protein [Candidatus Microthrix sp.]|uniref:YkvA family protein n=1 Tax=Candidatus Neomicrothrix sp. TaxID=2719034 RepID=UPI001B4B85DC|nr:YkvA family protein [Candidatus Microthrix sp.]MBP7988790.1 DUF1232 domain-containing protein [Candidatus Microthrix sp.]